MKWPAIAIDHVIESFRNGLWPGYKTGEGIAPGPSGRQIGGVIGDSKSLRIRINATEFIPADWRAWGVNAANASALAHTLCNERNVALLFRTLATLRTDIALFADVDALEWQGPKAGFETFGARLDAAVTRSMQHAGCRSSTTSCDLTTHQA